MQENTVFSVHRSHYIGFRVGDNDGLRVGLILGDNDGLSVGLIEGDRVGLNDGPKVL